MSQNNYHTPALYTETITGLVVKADCLGLTKMRPLYAMRLKTLVSRWFIPIFVTLKIFYAIMG